MTGPSFGRKALNFGKAVVFHAADGFHRADDDVVEKREGLCNICPANKGGECELCGCPVKLKVTWRSEKCPMEIW
jgi:hypothetical protein